MQEIKFDLGKNIVDTAQASGVPSFSSDDVNGSISYSVNAIPSQIPARFTRAGFEVTWRPIFAMTMYTNRRRDPTLAVYKVDLQLANTIRSHEAAQAFVEQTIAQFAKGKWQRYVDPVWKTLLTGRSSILNEAGQIDQMLMAIDPAYKIPSADWPKVAKPGAYWRWVGDGVLAELSVNQLGGDGSAADPSPLDYRLNLEFELLDVKLKRDAENQARDLKAGDAKGWNSTAKLVAAKKERAALLKRLEANAIKRGDSVVAKP